MKKILYKIFALAMVVFVLEKPLYIIDEEMRLAYFNEEVKLSQYTDESHVDGYDVTAPIITKIRFIGTTEFAKPFTGEHIVHLELDVTEEETGVSQIDINFAGDNTNFNTSAYFETNETTGTLGVDIEIPSNAKGSQYYIQQIMIHDGAGNTNEYYSMSAEYTEIGGVSGLLLSGTEEGCIWDSGFPTHFSVNSDDDEAPVVTSAEIMASTVNRGDNLSVYVEANDTSEIASIIVFMYRSDDGTGDNFGLYYYSDEGKKTDDGKYIVEGLVANGINVGEYCIGSILIEDINGNSDTYDYDVSVTGYFEDNNIKYIKSIYGNECIIKDGTVLKITSDGDVDAPNILNVSIQDGRVSKPGVVDVQFEAEDDTGIAEVDIYLYAIDGSGSLGGSVYYSEECTYVSGLVQILVPTTASAGEYIIGQIDVVDFEQNRRTYSFDFSEGLYKYFNDSDNNVDYLDDGFGSKAFINQGMVLIEEEGEVAFEVSLSNADIISRINGMSEGKTAKILIDGNGVVSDSIFEAIKEKDKTLVFYNSNYQWVFNGKDIAQAKSITLPISFSMMEPNFGSESQIVNIVFADNGVLPGRATIRIKSDYTFTSLGMDKEVYLYFLNNQNPEIVDDANVSDVLIDGTDHWCEFEVTHNSTFLLSNERLDNVEGNDNPSECYIWDEATKTLTVQNVDECSLPSENLKYDIERLVIKGSVKKIADYAFQNCYRLYYLTIEDGVESIGTAAFKNVPFKEVTIYSKDCVYSDYNSSAVLWPAFNTGYDYSTSVKLYAASTSDLYFGNVKSSSYNRIYLDDKCHLEFDPQNGTDVTTISGIENMPIDYIERIYNPVKVGYEFIGWYTAPIGGDLINVSETLCAGNDTTYYAHWKLKQYNVTFISNINGANFNETHKFFYGKEYRDIDNNGAWITLDDMNNMSFGGWYNDETKITSADICLGDMTLHACWNGRIKFDANGGETPEEYRDVQVYSSFGKLPIATRSGYKFLGWFSARNGGVVVSDTTVCYGNEVAYAHWEKNIVEGWKQDSKGWWYQNSDKTYPRSQWKQIGGKWYHFDANGYMQIGWLSDNGKWYYLESSGEMATNKWISGTYFVKADGVMATNEWVDNDKYYVDTNGKWVPNKQKIAAGWKQDKVGWWYQNSDGTYPRNKWQQINGTWYHFNASGYMQTGWLSDGGKWYYLESSGAMAVNKWISGIYYVESDGVMATSKWVDGGRYYVDVNGKWIPGK